MNRQQTKTPDHALPPVRPSQLVPMIEACIVARRPLYVVGPPGVGKSSIIRQAVDSLGYAFRDIRLPLLDAVDLRGLPMHDHDTGTVRWYPPAFLPAQDGSDGPMVILFDEMPNAASSVQTAALQLILDRRLGEYRLPDNVAMLAAGNRTSDGAGALRLTSSLANRFLHVELDANIEDWRPWAVGPGHITPHIVAFLSYKTELFHDFDPSRAVNATPRTWEFASDVLSMKLPADVEHALLIGTVGEGPATELSAFMRVYRTLPNLDALLMSPDSTPVPGEDQLSTLYALTFALAHRATVNNLGAVLTYLDRCPQEFAVMSVKAMTARDRSLYSTPDFTRWASTNSHLLS